jgi:hypothetical protein
MRIEEGKYYRTRGGRKVGPMRATDNNHWPMECDGTWWRADGESCEGSMARMYPENDIVAEWTEHSPVRTVERKEVVPGVYGRVDILDVSKFAVWRVGIGFVSHHGTRSCAAYLTASELRDLSRVALELADYLDAQ